MYPPVVESGMRKAPMPIASGSLLEGILPAMANQRIVRVRSGIFTVGEARVHFDGRGKRAKRTKILRGRHQWRIN